MKPIVLCCGIVAALTIGIAAENDDYPDIREVTIPMRDGVL